MKFNDYFGNELPPPEITELPHGWVLVRWLPVLQNLRDDIFINRDEYIPTMCFIPKPADWINIFKF